MTTAQPGLMSKRVTGAPAIRVGDMEIAPPAQRRYDPRWADHKAVNFRPEVVRPVISKRNGHNYIVDGQHGVGAGKAVGVFTDDTTLECTVFDGLTESEEAELFLLLNDAKKVNTFDSFRVAMTAGRVVERNIARICHEQGLTITRGRAANGVAAIAGLRYVYALGDDVLSRALRILNESYNGAPEGFQVHLLRGMGLVCQRYNGQLDDGALSRRLGELRGGTIALTRKADALKLKTGHDKANCVAAAIVETYNTKSGGKKLESWWR